GGGRAPAALARRVSGPGRGRAAGHAAHAAVALHRRRDRPPGAHRRRHADPRPQPVARRQGRPRPEPAQPPRTLPGAENAYFASTFSLSGAVVSATLPKLFIACALPLGAGETPVK